MGAIVKIIADKYGKKTIEPSFNSNGVIFYDIINKNDVNIDDYAEIVEDISKIDTGKRDKRGKPIYVSKIKVNRVYNKIENNFANDKNDITYIAYSNTNKYTIKGEKIKDEYRIGYFAGVIPAIYHIVTIKSDILNRKDDYVEDYTIDDIDKIPRDCPQELIDELIKLNDEFEKQREEKKNMINNKIKNINDKIDNILSKYSKKIPDNYKKLIAEGRYKIIELAELLNDDDYDGISLETQFICIVNDFAFYIDTGGYEEEVNTDEIIRPLINEKVQKKIYNYLKDDITGRIKFHYELFDDVKKPEFLEEIKEIKYKYKSLDFINGLSKKVESGIVTKKPTFNDVIYDSKLKDVEKGEIKTFDTNYFTIKYIPHLIKGIIPYPIIINTRKWRGSGESEDGMRGDIEIEHDYLIRYRYVAIEYYTTAITYKINPSERFKKEVNREYNLKINEDEVKAKFEYIYEEI